MGLLIDTNILITCERGQLNLEDVVSSQGDVSVFLSVISVSEMLHGVNRASDEKIKTHRMAFVENILECIEILDIDVTTARIHSRIWSDLTVKGQLIGAHDLWIAASALANNYSLVTRNVREFERIPGLHVVVW